MSKCEICGEPMPDGEEMFKFHGYSGGCPKPPLPRDYGVEGVKKIFKQATDFDASRPSLPVLGQDGARTT